MHEVSFALQASDYSTVKLYRLTGYSQEILSKCSQLIEQRRKSSNTIAIE